MNEFGTRFDMLCRVEPEWQDLAAFRRACAARMPLRCRLFVPLWPALAGPVAVMMALLSGDGAIQAAIQGAVFLAVGLIFCALLWYSRRRDAKSAFNNPRRAFGFVRGAYTFACDEEGLSVIREGSFWQAPWPTVTTCWRTRTHLFLVVTKLTVVALPARSFSRKADFDACCATATGLMARAPSELQARAASDPPAPAALETTEAPTRSDGVEISYEFTSEDAEAFFRSTLTGKRLNLWERLPAFLGIPSFGTLGFGWDLYTSYPWFDSSAHLVSGVVCAVLSSFFLRLFIGRVAGVARVQSEDTDEVSVRRMVELPWVQAALGPTRVRVTADGVGELSPSARVLTPWSQASRVVRDGPRAYIYVGGLTASIIPRRAFATDQEFEAFIDRADALRAAAVSEAA